MDRHRQPQHPLCLRPNPFAGVAAEIRNLARTTRERLHRKQQQADDTHKERQGRDAVSTHSAMHKKNSLVSV